MRVNERFDQLEEKIRKLEKDVAALKQGTATVTMDGEAIATAVKPAKATKTRKTTTKE